jgi:hypothetical protein
MREETATLHLVVTAVGDGETMVVVVVMDAGVVVAVMVAELVGVVEFPDRMVKAVSRANLAVIKEAYDQVK